MKRRWNLVAATVLVVAMIVSLSLIGCKTTTATTTAAETTAAVTTVAETTAAETTAAANLVIGVLVKTQTDPYQRLLNENTHAALEALKTAGKIADYIELDANGDVQKQVNNCDDLIAKKVSVILMSAVDSNGAAPVADKCKEANIPLVEVNARTSNVDIATAFVGSDDVQAGEMMGNFVIDKLGGKGNAKGNIGHLEGVIGNSAQIDRTQGIANTLGKEPGIKFLAELTGNWQRADAMAIVEDWIQKFPTIDAICSDNDDMGMGAMNALIAAGRKEKTILVSVDAIKDAVAAVNAGTYDCTILQDAKGQATKSVEVAYNVITGGQYEKETMIPFVIITKDNVADYLQ